MHSHYVSLQWDGMVEWSRPVSRSLGAAQGQERKRLRWKKDLEDPGLEDPRMLQETEERGIGESFRRSTILSYILERDGISTREANQGSARSERAWCAEDFLKLGNLKVSLATNQEQN